MELESSSEFSSEFSCSRGVSDRPRSSVVSDMAKREDKGNNERFMLR
jgi:hypothetical protein